MAGLLEILPSSGVDTDRFLASIIESAEDAIITKDLNGTITSWNAAAQRLLGYTAEEAIGQSVFLIVPPEAADEEENVLQRIRAGERTEHWHTARMNKAGHRVMVSVTVSPIKAADGRIIGSSSIARDITPQVKAEQQLNAQAKLLDLSFDAIIVRDRDDRVAFWNRGAHQLYGWSKDEALGKQTHALLATEFPRPLHEIREILAQTGRWEGELVHTRRDGSRLTVISRWVQEWDDAGKPASILESNNDISQWRRAETELQAAREKLAMRADRLEIAVKERTTELQASMDELEEISYSLSHDIRAPLRTIQSFCQIVLERAGARLEPEDQELMHRAIKAANRLDRLIHDVLTYKKVSSGDFTLVDVNLDALLRQIIAERPEFQPPKATIEVSGPLGVVTGHEAYLSQCFTNIIDNAVKFVAPGRLPRVRIWSEAQDDCAQICFQDNGIGIPRDAEGRIFGMFQKLHPASEYPGTGIGLAIVKRAAERMEGSVGVESTPGHGSRFWIRLPRRKN